MAERKSVCKKSYLSAEGDPTNSATADSLGVRFAFTNGETLEAFLADYPGGMQRCFGVHGISQKLGDEYSGAKGDADEAVLMWTALQERIMAEDWVQKGEAGMPSTVLAEALWRAFKDTKDAIAKDPDGEAKCMAHVKSLDKEARAALSAQPAVKANIDTIKSERAAERAKASREAAKGAEVALPSI